MTRQYLSELSNEELIARGYRCVSRKYGAVSRIDQANWIEILATYMRRSVEEISDRTRNGGMQDFYRRVLSKDVIELGNARGRNFPSSNSSRVGFVDISDRTNDPAGEPVWIIYDGRAAYGADTVDCAVLESFGPPSAHNDHEAINYARREWRNHEYRLFRYDLVAQAQGLPLTSNERLIYIGRVRHGL